MTSLWIVRHGDTFLPGEPPRRIGARSDPPLAPTGQAQGRALGAAFARMAVGWGQALCSPQRRATETAALVLAPTGGVAEVAAWLAEIDHGPDEDAAEAAVVARVGRPALDRWDREGVPPPDWIVDPDARCAAWRDCLAATARGGRDVLVVTSNGAARFALLAEPAVRAAAAGLPSLKLRTGAWGRLALDGAGWRIAAWDRRP